MMKARNGCINNLRYLCLIAVFALGLMTIVGSNGGDSDTQIDQTEEEDSTAADPYEGLEDVTSKGEIQCSEDNCCFRRCSNNSLLCVTRQPDILASHFSDLNCDSILFPEWFYANDCFVYLDQSYAYEESGEQRVLVWIQCFCGRTADNIAGETSINTVFRFEGCNEPMTHLPGTGEPEIPEINCIECYECQPNCVGKECGSDGCGGSCGTCPDGKICNAAGECVSSGSGDTCSECLAACQGLPGCCTGCGCMCEYECGGCFYPLY